MKLTRVLLAVLFLSAFAINAHAQWSDGARTTSLTGDEVGIAGAADDGANGVVVAWSNNVTNLVYATRYYENNLVAWGPIQLGTIDHIDALNPVQVVRQGSNWFVAWFDPDDVNSVHAYKIRLAKLNSSGSVTASTSFGVADPIDASVVVEDLSLVARTGGGIAVGYRIDDTGYVRLYSSTLSLDIDLESGAGHFQDGGNGINLIRVVADGSDGVYVIWGSTSYPEHVSAQLYNSSGTRQWTPAREMINSAGRPDDLAVARDGHGGFVLAAQCFANTVSKVRVQHLANDGYPKWNESLSINGEPICSSSTNQVDPEIIVNKSRGAAVISWSETVAGVTAIRLQKVPVDSLLSFGLSWDPAGVQANISTYPGVGRPRIASNIDDQTAVAWTYWDGIQETGIRFQMIGDDGDVELDADKDEFTLTPTSTPTEISALVSQPLGAYAPHVVFTGDDFYLFTRVMLPPFFYDIEYEYNEAHCSTPISWRTLTGSTSNQLKYRAVGATTWSTKNATGSGSIWSSSVNSYLEEEFKMTASFGGASQESSISQQWSHCGPDPTSPMPEKRITEVFLKAHPNPFNPQVSVDYGVPALSRVELAIFDASGRRIKTLMSGTKAPGAYSETWNGTSENGERVASGVYFSRLTVSGKTMTQKLVMLK